MGVEGSTIPAMRTCTPSTSSWLIGSALLLALSGCDSPSTAQPGESADGGLPAPAYELAGEVCRERFNVGESVKAFELPSLDGNSTIAPSQYAGRVMVLNFWGTWCKPCLEELPAFGSLHRMYFNHGMSLVAVATDEDPGPVQAFVDKHALVADIALSGEDAAGAYGRPEFPYTFVVNGEGTIVAAYQFVDGACMGDLEQVVRDELAKL